MSLILSRHAEARCQQRGFTSGILELLASIGSETDKGLFLGNREADALIARLKGAIKLVERTRNRCLVIENGTIVTAYKGHSRRGRGRRIGADK